MTAHMIVESLCWVVVVLGILILGYGTFATPDEGDWRADRPFFRIRKIGGAMTILGLLAAIAVVKLWTI